MRYFSGLHKQNNCRAHFIVTLTNATCSYFVYVPNTSLGW